MKQKTAIFLSLVLSILAISCTVSKDYITNVFKKEALSFSKAQSVLVTSSDRIQINSFEKTFEKNYESVEDFAYAYNSKLVRSLKSNRVFSIINVEEVNKWNVLSEGINAKNLASVNDLVNQTTATYVLFIDRFTISNRIENRYVSNAGFNNNMGSGHYNSIEYCVVTATVEIYNLITKERIATFQTTGESSVFLFDFTKTFERAKERSIAHIVNFLKTGKVEYPQY